MSSTASHFLRRSLLIDAAASGLTGALMLVAGGVMEELLDLPASLLRGAGLVLVPYVAFVAFVATRPQISSSAVWAVIAANALWTVASFAILAGGLVAPNSLGTAFVVAQALAVAGLGALQYVALRRSHPAVA